MYLHPTYAVTPEREPLGIMDALIWAREKKDKSGNRGGPKESLRWMEGSATCLIAREIDAPAGAKPIKWRLLTNRAAATLASAVELIDWYRARCGIEILFNVLKNACKVEVLQLGSIEKLKRVMALLTGVAWRIAHLMRMGQTCPHLNAEPFFDPDEIQAATIRLGLKDVHVAVKTMRALRRLSGQAACV